MDKIKEIQEVISKIEVSLENVIIGQKDVIEGLVISILGEGHVLLQGVPGLAKTLMVTSLAKVLDLDFKRIQFTPDLMPSDIIGTEILVTDSNTHEKSFKFIKGPIFTNILLADEINRTPPKTQAALLQAMQEGEVSSGGIDYKIDSPFFVLATQNPIEQEGTYPLPEAQLDRFFMNLKVDYPSLEEEIAIVQSKEKTKSDIKVRGVINSKDLIVIKEIIKKIPVPLKIVEKAVSLVRKTRPDSSEAESITKECISWGAGPRASQFLVHAAKIKAAISGKPAPDISDLFLMAKPILRHRIVPSFKARASGIEIDEIIENLLKTL